MCKSFSRIPAFIEMSLRVTRALRLQRCIVPAAVFAALMLWFPAAGLRAATISAVEQEPNNAAATATPLPASGDARVIGNIASTIDEDFYSFTAQAGDRVYAAVMTSASNVGSGSQLRIIGPDGTTVLETDLADGVFATSSSSIAGTVIPTSGNYFIAVSAAASTSRIAPYDLWFRLRRGTPSPEFEPNNVAPGLPLATSGWVSGLLTDASDVDQFTVPLKAGDSVFVSLDFDPDRDGFTWNGRVAFGPFGAGAATIVADDASTTSPNSEALFATVENDGVYSIAVSTASTFGNYRMSVSVLEAATETFRVFPSTGSPLEIPEGPATVTSTVIVPDDIRVGRVRVVLDFTHANPADLDVTLVAPEGNIVSLFTDVGSAIPISVAFTIDDTAALPIGATELLPGLIYRPENRAVLDYFTGQRAQGAWTLVIRDDGAGAGGVLNSWRLELIEQPGELGSYTTLYSSDFEADDGGFTHGGAADEWQWGTPTAAPITTANSGSKVWKTDLDGTYDGDSNQDLFSPIIDLTAYGPGSKVLFTWFMKYQMENATFDQAFVEVQEIGGAGLTKRVWEWQGATMSTTEGNPPEMLPITAGWARHQALISEFAGKLIRLRFHLSGDPSFNFAGLAIDDVSVGASTPPVLTVPATTLTFEATSSDGADVSFDVTASDAEDDPEPLPTTVPPPGLFPLGITTVTASVTDSSGLEASREFNVQVTDTTAPVLSPVSAAPLFAGDPLPDYRPLAGATDIVGVASLVQVPPPGTIVAEGILPLKITAADAAGNSSEIAFEVVARRFEPFQSVLISTSEIVPGAGTPDGPPAGATVTGFGVPAIDQSGNVAFTATWTSPAGVGSGIFVGSELRLAIGETLPTAPGATIQSVSEPVIDSGDFASIVKLAGVPKSSASAVISDAGSGQPEVVARAGETAPGTGGAQFRRFDSVEVAGRNVAVFAQLVQGTGTPITTKANDSGIWIKPAAGPLQLALREGQLINGSAVRSLVSFRGGNRSPGQGRGWLDPAGATVLARVSFTDKSQALVSADAAGNVSIISETGTGGIGGPLLSGASFKSYGFPASNSADAAFLGTLTTGAGGVTKSNARAVFESAGGAEFGIVARAGTSAGTTGAFFKSFLDPVLASDGSLSFIAKLSGGGVRGAAATSMWYRAPGGALTLVAQGGAEPPGVEGARWQDFASLAIISGHGPLFTATMVPGKGGVTPKAAEGVWGYDSTRVLRLLFRTGTEVVPGKRLKKMALLNAVPGSTGVTRSFNDAGMLMWRATFEDNSSALMLTEIP
jgi:subtilisin-like proprotein convertase family protein